MNIKTGISTKEVSQHPQRWMNSLRARITLAITAITILAVISVGFLVFTRNQTTQTFFGNQFQASVNEKAEDQVQALVVQEAQSINNFFSTIDQTVVSTALFAGNLLDQTATFENGVYWNAEQKLVQRPDGAWDNPNTDLASVFIPANIEFEEQKKIEINTVIQLDGIAPDILQTNPEIVAIYYNSKNEFTVYYPNNNLADILPSDFRATEQPYYLNATSVNRGNSVWSLPFQDSTQTGLIVTNSSPVFDGNLNLRGVIGADVQLLNISDNVENLEIGETGYGFLIDSDGHILAMPDEGYKDLNIVPEVMLGNESPQQTIFEQSPQSMQLIFQSMAQGGRGLTRVEIQDTEHYIAYAPITSPGYSLGVIVPVSELDAAVRQAQELVSRENQQTRNYVFLLIAIVIIGATVISFGLSRVLTNPLNQLTNTAQKVSTGDLTARAPETSLNEVNLLSEAFNTMTTQLREMLGGLEERVTERTAELEDAHQQSLRRSAQFEAIAQVTREISESQDLEFLLPRITEVISKQFRYYHVGIFLLNLNKDYAVLRAANSTGGQKMLARGHQLRVGETGLVGYATSRGKARIALDTGTDAVFFDNPDLPETRSEIALPMIVADQVIGALDVQSKEANAFSQQDIDILTILAAQVGIAIQNATIFAETRKALSQAQILTQQTTALGWSQFTRTQKLTGIRRSMSKSILTHEPVKVDSLVEENSINLPISLRGQIIGDIKIKSASQHKWTQDEVDIATAIIERAAIALENARLLNEAQRRATRERIIGEISSSVSTSTDMDDILRNAVQELGRKMGGAEVVLELGINSQEKEKTKE